MSEPDIIFGRRIPDTLEDLLREPSALVVWDMQEHARSAIGFAQVADRIGRLIAAARRSHRLIVYTQHYGVPLAFEDRVTVRKEWRRAGRPAATALRTRFLRGSPEWQFAPETAPTSDDIVVAKNRPSGFVGTSLAAVLAKRCTDVLFLTGVATDKGILSTAREAVQRGLFPVVVRDAVSTDTAEAQERGLRELAEVADLCTTEQVLAQWHPGGTRSTPPTIDSERAT